MNTTHEGIPGSPIASGIQHHFTTGRRASAAIEAPPRGKPANWAFRLLGIASSTLALALSHSAQASTAYGTLNNFDCVNDTGVEAHGFEIELDDLHSRDITYTYDYNHYGIPKITEDSSDPLHPRVFIRYAGIRRPDGTCTAYTPIPAGPLAPTQRH